MPSDDGLLVTDLIEEDLNFECPYCGEENFTRHEPEGGRFQRFVVDCGICCRPILIQIHSDGTEIVSFQADPENP